MKFCTFLLLALVWGGLGVPALSWAQPGGGENRMSLEARMLQSPVVFAATLTNYLKNKVHTGPPDHPYAAYDYVLTFRVDQVFKGSRTNQALVLTFPDIGTCAEFERWTTNRDAFLFFAGEGESEASLASRFFGEVNFILLGPTRRRHNLTPEADSFNQVYGQNLTIYPRGEDILYHARAFARNPPATTNVHRLYLPELSSPDHAFFNCFLTVPVGPPLERLARQLVARPDDYITAKSNAILRSQWRCDWRAEGVSALQYFKTPHNIRLLKSLLTAPDCRTGKVWSAQYQDQHATNKIYEVRRRAYEVLHGWGVEVPKPVTEEISVAR